MGWNPGGTTVKPIAGNGTFPAALRMPYENRQEPLGREAWLVKYKDAAPQLQHLMDELVKGVKEWGSKVEQLRCTGSDGGDDVQGMVEEVRVVEKACKQVQDTARTIGHGIPFEPQIPVGRGGFVPVNCEMNDAGRCKALNCYVEDPDLGRELTHLQTRAKKCQEALQLLKKEEKASSALSSGGNATVQGGRGLSGAGANSEIVGTTSSIFPDLHGAPQTRIGSSPLQNSSCSVLFPLLFETSPIQCCTQDIFYRTKRSLRSFLV